MSGALSKIVAINGKAHNEIAMLLADSRWVMEEPTLEDLEAFVSYAYDELLKIMQTLNIDGPRSL